jgi:hypothetical protein
LEIQPIGWGLACSTGCCFSKSWSGEAVRPRARGSECRCFSSPLVLYLSQVCLQPLSKVSGSPSSGDLWLCPGRHLGFLNCDFLKTYYFFDFIHHRPNGWCIIIIKMLLIEVQKWKSHSVFLHQNINHVKEKPQLYIMEL